MSVHTYACTTWVCVMMCGSIMLVGCDTHLCVPVAGARLGLLRRLVCLCAARGEMKGYLFSVQCARMLACEGRMHARVGHWGWEGEGASWGGPQATGSRPHVLWALSIAGTVAPVSVQVHLDGSASTFAFYWAAGLRAHQAFQKTMVRFVFVERDHATNLPKGVGPRCKGGTFSKETRQRSPSENIMFKLG